MTGQPPEPLDPGPEEDLPPVLANQWDERDDDSGGTTLGSITRSPDPESAESAGSGADSDATEDEWSNAPTAPRSVRDRSRGSW